MSIVTLHNLNTAAWIGLGCVWLAGLLFRKPLVRVQSRVSRIWQMAMLGVGAWLLFATTMPAGWLAAQVYEVSVLIATIGFIVMLLGLGFAIWARIVLGGNWSSGATVKAAHELVRKGPYRIVRHPIYTGILAGVIGTALMYGSVHNLIAIPFVVAGFWLKMRTEEQFMIQQFGNRYIEYRQHVKALAPFVF